MQTTSSRIPRIGTTTRFQISPAPRPRSNSPAQVRLTPDISVAIIPLHIQFPASAGAFVFGGANSITTGIPTVTGEITNNSTETQTFNVPVIIRRGRIISTAGDVVLNGTVNIGGNGQETDRNLIVDGPNEVFLNGTLEGMGTSSRGGGFIQKQGTGILHITSNSPLWAGRFGVNGGVLGAEAPNALGESTAARSYPPLARQLELAGSVTFAPERLDLGGRITGTSPIHLRNFSGDNIWTGPINLATGGGEYGFESAAGKVTIAGNINNNNANDRAIRTLRLPGRRRRRVFRPACSRPNDHRPLDDPQGRCRNVDVKQFHDRDRR